MKGKYTYRIINTVITAIGTLLCIVSGFIPAPYGLLSDGTISLIQSLPGSQKAVSFLLPALLFIAATVIVGAGRYRLGSLITVLAGSCIFALMDLSYIKASMAFAGTLLNELGIVIALSGVLLHAFGTPKGERAKNESLMKTLDSFLKAELAPEPDPKLAPKLAAEPESDAVSKPAPEPESEPKAAESAAQTDLPEEIGGTDEQQENDALAEITPAGDPITYTQVLQPINEGYVDLIEEAGDPVKYTQVLWPADTEIEELAAEAGEMTEEAAQKEIHEAALLENTIVLDADFEDLLINADGQEN